MFAVPEKVKSVTHPRITSMHMKKDYGMSRKNIEDVLVIDTGFSHLDDGENYDDYLLDILLDLDELKMKAESSFGKIDRIDIITH